MESQNSKSWQQEEKRNKFPLPDSSDRDFWLDADIHTNIVPHSELADHGHYFERVRGHQAYCEGCGWGFELDPGDTVKDGHLYDRSKKLVI